MEQAGSPMRGKPNNWRRKTEGKIVSRKLKGHVLAVGLHTHRRGKPIRNDSDSSLIPILRTPQWVKRKQIKTLGTNTRGRGMTTGQPRPNEINSKLGNSNERKRKGVQSPAESSRAELFNQTQLDGIPLFLLFFFFLYNFYF